MFRRHCYDLMWWQATNFMSMDEYMDEKLTNIWKQRNTWVHLSQVGNFAVANCSASLFVTVQFTKPVLEFPCHSWYNKRVVITIVAFSIFSAFESRLFAVCTLRDSFRRQNLVNRNHCHSCTNWLWADVRNLSLAILASVKSDCRKIRSVETLINYRKPS